MAGSNDFTIRVRVSGAQDVDAINKALAGLGATVVNTNRRTKQATDASNDFFDTQKKGIIGTANSTKSFSKLAETIGTGSSGIVGAYATLAANIFAVTAAFNALRNAAQVEQILRGLEAAGTRTGLSLVGTAKALKEVTGSAINTEQAMRSTAQIISAGFDARTVERLGKAAKDTSFALGRNMTDSLDRLSRGIVKLEPELLDELGIMTKLTESNVNYARSLGKSESQLTSLERRQGFANAVLAEAELKFGGLSAAAGDATAYDQLASTFTDLTNSVFNLLNVIGKPVAAGLATSMTTLAGVSVLFASTIKSQLLPGLANYAVRASAAAQASKESSARLLENIKVTRDAAAAERAAALAARENIQYRGTQLPKVYAAARDEILKTIGTTEQLAMSEKKGMNSLAASIRANRAILQRPDYVKGTEKGDNKRSEQAALLQEQRALRALEATRRQVANSSIEDDNRVAAARRAAAIARTQASAAEASAASIGAASQLKLGESWNQLTNSVKLYAKAQLSAGATSLTTLQRVTVAYQGLTIAARAAATAFLSALPYIGMVAVAIGVLKGAYDSLKSDAVKRLEKATESLAEATGKANDFGAELARINDSQASASLRAASALTVQANAIREATEKYEEFVRAYRNRQSDDVSDLFGKNTENRVASWWQTLGARGALSFSEGLKKNSRALDLAEVMQERGFFGEGLGRVAEPVRQAIGYFNSLEQSNKEGLDAVIKTRGGYEQFLKTLKGMSATRFVSFMEELGNQVNSFTKGNEDSVKTFQDTFKELGNQLADFARTSIPTTPYDNLVKAFDASSRSALELMQRLDPAKMTQLLSGLDAGVIRALNVDTQRDIEEYQKADKIVQDLKALRKQLESRGEKLSATQQRDLELAQATLENQVKLGTSISKQITQRTDLVKQAQEEERLMKSQLAVLNAQMQSNSRIYQAGAAGMKARLDAEERARNLQVSTLQTQLNVTKTLSGNLEVQIKDLELQRQKLEVGKLQLKNYKDQRLESLKAMQDQVRLRLDQLDTSTERAEELTSGGKKLPVDRLPGQRRDFAIAVNNWRAIKTLMESTIDPAEELKRREAEIKAIDGNILDLRRQSRDVLHQITALQNQITAILEENLDIQQKSALLAGAQRQYYAQSVGTLNEQAKSLGALNTTYAEIDARVAGISDRLDYQMDQIRRRAQLERTEMSRNRTAELGQLESNLAIAEADLQRERRQGREEDIKAAEATVQFAENALKISEQGYDITLQQIDATERLALAEKALFDSRTQGLEFQKTALEYLQKTIDAQKTLSDEEQNSYSIRQRLSAKRGGYQVSDAGAQATEIESARRAYDFALQEAGVKKSLIDLEYALLESQRDNLIFELRARQTMYQAGTTQFEQIEAVIGKIATIDFGAASNTAKKAVDMAVRNKYDELQLSRTTTGTENKFSKGMAAIVGALERNTAILGSQRDAPPKSIPQQSVVIDRNSQPTLDQVPMSPQIQSNQLLIKAIDALRESIQLWLRDNPLNSVNVDSSEYGRSEFKATAANLAGASENVKTAMAFFTSKGLSNAQAAGIVGNLQQESTPLLDPTSRNGNMRGIAQWDTGRQAKFLQLFGEKLENAGIVKQLEFLWHEMRNDPYEKGRLNSRGFFADGKSAAEYAKIFEDAFERSNGSKLGTRMSNAAKLVSTAGVEFREEIRGAARDFRASNDNEPIIVGASNRLRTPEQVLTQGPAMDIDPVVLNIDTEELKGRIDSALANATTASDGVNRVRGALEALDVMTESSKEALRELGPEGELLAGVMSSFTSVSNGVLNVLDVFTTSTERMQGRLEQGMSQSQANAIDFSEKFTAIASVASTALAGVQSALAASANAKVQAIDKEIAAEQKRDGKSAESLQKLQALEKKKDEIAKKQFNTNKKLQMAQAVIATATGVAQALAYGPIIGPILAGVIAAMGAAQLAIISGTQYQSSVSSAATAIQTPTLSIGKRGDSVDLAKNNPNLGGELGYLRGKQGRGSNSGNYSVIGSAYGGDLGRGYGHTAYAVGEKGPEVLTPDLPFTVRPMNDNNQSAAPVSASISIHAVDAAGVESVLHDQRGNIISMLREAANSNGTPFMENVNTNAYSRPNKTANSRL